MLPMDKTEPMLPMDSTDPLEPIDKKDPFERQDRYDLVDRCSAISRCSLRADSGGSLHRCCSARVPESGQESVTTILPLLLSDAACASPMCTRANSRSTSGVHPPEVPRSAARRSRADSLRAFTCSVPYRAAP